MRFALAPVLALLALPPLPALADPSAIRDTIDRQIEAFRADDLAAAFGYASPGIQGVFGDAANFGRMVRGGYPMVWRPERLDYLPAEERGPGRWTQDVLIEDAQGRLHGLRYFMVETPEGWRIDGVSFLEPDEPTA